jgi:prephenate dehydrogenase
VSVQDGEAAAELPLAALAGFRLVIVGTGLIGTSVALALRRHGTDVALADRDPARLSAAAGRGAGRPWAAGEAGDHVLLAVPPRAVAPTLLRWQRELPSATFSDTSSVQDFTARQAALLGCRLDVMCGSHPVAGSASAGPAAADAGLFTGRVWIVTPSRATGRTALARARLVARGCGARVVGMPAADHDRIMALVSHLPQVVASAVAARLAGAPEDAVRSAGDGLRDLTRIAGSDPSLWQDILTTNAPSLEPVLAALVGDLERVRAALLAGGGPAAIRHVLEQGNQGRARLDRAAVPRPPAPRNPAVLSPAIPDGG